MASPIYNEENHAPYKDLISGLRQAVDDLERASMATKNLTRSGRHAGFGIDKSKKQIAADGVIAVARAIKAKPGW